MRTDDAGSGSFRSSWTQLSLEPSVVAKLRVVVVVLRREPSFACVLTASTNRDDHSGLTSILSFVTREARCTR
jgi:hypothetical protein